MDSNINMVNHNFTITKGDSLQFTITIEDTQVEPSDIIFTVKDESFDGEDVIHYSLLHGEITKSITYHILSIPITIAILGFSFTLCYDYITKSFLTERLFKIVNKCFSYWYISVPCCLIVLGIWILKI